MGLAYHEIEELNLLKANSAIRSLLTIKLKTRSTDAEEGPGGGIRQMRSREVQRTRLIHYNTVPVETPEKAAVFCGHNTARERGVESSATVSVWPFTMTHQS